MRSTETALTSDVRGAVLRRGDDRLPDELAGFQTAHPHRPDVVVGARDADDVVAAVRHAAAHDLPVAVQATGHGHTTGLERGVVVTTGRMRGVSVDPVSRTARVGAGARSADLVGAAAGHGLAPVSGSFPGVGVVGYTLGGGLGLLGREHGWASDHLRAAEVVTADGILRRVGPGDELFAALRGGRPEVGIVTAVEVGLVPLGEVVGGGLFVEAEDAGRLVPVVRRLGDEAPESLGISLGVVPVPDLDVVPAPIRGRTVLHVRLVAPDAAVARAAEDAVREAAPVLLGGLRELPWTESGSIVGEPEVPHAYEGTNVLVTTLSDEALGSVVAAARSASVGCVVDVRRLGGALARPADGPDAVSFRDAGWIVRVLSSTEGESTAAVRAAHAAVLAPVADAGLGRMAAFVYGGSPVSAAELHSPAVRELLARVRAEHDPRGVFGPC
ncbi:FAD-binding oxidoreductase [Actinomycetospora sp. TBRC 11914]|uniref:FAD-binding oxidoreductase n=1 Tax=Actinomycetospora sp. TBRC 11914 TaxID=2729387 RepID=UPI00145E1ED2|nr:FAD-binding protein [Actinomycetospora sp. TBRC 11914]NMO90801.1 FAD-binding oxidoreductase [Actinomycetospora sp. TBRC 11914]